MPEVKKGDTKPGRRSPLKLADDRGGSVYIKGLKEVFVTSSDEAYQLLMIGAFIFYVFGITGGLVVVAAGIMITEALHISLQSA